MLARCIGMRLEAWHELESRPQTLRIRAARIRVIVQLMSSLLMTLSHTSASLLSKTYGPASTFASNSSATHTNAGLRVT